MKQSIVKLAAIILLLVPLAGMSQSDEVAKIFDKYSAQDGFTSVDISKGLFELFAEIEADDPEFDGCAPRHVYPGLDRLHDLIQMDVSRDNGVGGVGDPDKGSLDFGVTIADGL